MDLPLDHFRLLGVSPASDAQTVLRTLATRLDRAPDQGFTADTLLARAELLRASADLLSDAERRLAYESDLTALSSREGSVVAALEVSSSREVAGLLLLLEAGQPADCFELVCRSLQPPQAPKLDNSSEADLTLLAGLSCLEAAAECKRSRHFESASGLLKQGLQLLQRMGQAPELRERMSQELESLTPYRVLDLISRDLAASSERAEGVALLEQLVQRRGGLESNSDPEFSAEEFQAFFHQIRGFLTVQEQVDLFSRWGDAGSEAADFLASTALTASGFAQRKPERIAAAQDRLQANGRQDMGPLLANLHLLLGDVETALQTFENGANKDLKAWAARQSDDPLAQLCAYCRDWLSRDVLPGYRDLDADPDLVAYFNDRDVVAWVEQEDRRSGRNFESPAPDGFETLTPSGVSPGGLDNFDWTLPYINQGPAERDPNATEPDDDEKPLGWRLPELNLPRISLPSTKLLGIASVLLLVVAAGASLLWKRPTGPQQAPVATATPALPPAVRPPSPAQPSPAKPTRPEATKPDIGKAQSPAGLNKNSQSAAPAQPSGPIRPLTAAEPGSKEISDLLESWLAAKTQVLAGASLPTNLDAIARNGMVERLASERRQDAAAGEVQAIAVGLDDLEISERTAGRIAVIAKLRYSDSRRNAAGKLVESTPSTHLRNVYVFGRDGDRWRLAATYPAN